MLNFDDLKQILKEQEQNAELFQQNEIDTELKHLKLEQEKLKLEQLKLKNENLKPRTENSKPKADPTDKVFLIGVTVSVLAIVIQALFFIFLVK